MMKEIKYDALAGTGVKIDSAGHVDSATVFLPEKYDSRELWPTILWFHGAGEASATRAYSQLLANGLLKNIRAGLSIPFIVIAVQDQWSTPSPAVMKYTLDNTFLKTYKIDASEIYTTGLSYGGGGSLAMAIAYPGLISAVVSASPSALQPAEVESLGVLAKNNVPVWFWYGTKDTGPFGDNAKNCAARITAAGGQAWITTEPVGHGPWDGLYTGKSLLSGMDVYDFFSQYRKGIASPPLPPASTRKLIATIRIYDNGDIEKQ